VTATAARPALIADQTELAWRVARALYYLGVLFLGLVAVRPILGFTISDWLFLAALIVTVPLVLIRRSLSETGLPWPVVAGVALIVVGGLLSSLLQAGSPVGSLAVVLRLAYLLLAWLWLGRVLLREPGQLRTAIVLWTVSAAVNGLVALGQLWFGASVPGATSLERLGGLTLHVNDLGALTAIALVPALAVTAGMRSRSVPWGIAVVVLIITGLIVSGSVGGFISAVVGLVVWFARGPGRLRSAAVLILCLVVSAALILAASTIRPPLTRGGEPDPFGRVVSVLRPSGEGTGGTFWMRLDGYREAAARIARQPIVGAGLDEASAKTTTGLEVHNTLLAFWYGAGIFGFLGIVLILLYLVLTGVRIPSWPRGSPVAGVGVGLVGATVAFLVFIQAAPIDTQRYAWVAPALLLVVGAHAARWDRATD
jgi:O-antigen ligase